MTSAEEDRIQRSADPAEARATLWTIKEGLVKLGVGSLDDMASWDVGGVLTAPRAGLRIEGVEYSAYRLLSPDDTVAHLVSRGSRRVRRFAPGAL